MPAKRFPISNEAIAAAAWFMRWGRREYRRAREPFRPSLRQTIGYLVRRGLVDAKAPPPPVTLQRALKRAGVVLVPHWRTAQKKNLEVNISRSDPSISVPTKRDVAQDPTLCSSVDDGGTTRSPRRRAFDLSHRQMLAHPWQPARSLPPEEGAR